MYIIARYLSTFQAVQMMNMSALIRDVLIRLGCATEKKTAHRARMKNHSRAVSQSLYTITCKAIINQLIYYLLRLCL